MHHIIRRSCQCASQQAPRLRVPLNGGARRAFSQSNACQRGSLPQFLEPSSPELGTILSRLNSKVLLPHHLTKEQEQLVYKQENKARLEAEPIEITLGDVTLPLEHIDRNRDQPNRWATIKNVVELSKTPEDWENVVRMMEGFHDAGIRLQSQKLQKIVRRLYEADMPHLVLKALQRASKTGLRLREHDLTMAVLQGLHRAAAVSDWDASETTKMLRFSEQVIELMEDDEHLGKRTPDASDLRASPFVIAAPLELAAVRAKRHNDAKDTDGKVQKYASRLMNALPQSQQIDTFVNQVDEYVEKSQTDPAGIARLRLEHHLLPAIPLWNALKTANQVLGTSMPEAELAKKTEKAVWDAISKGQARHQSLSNGNTPRFLDDAIAKCQHV